MDLFWTDLMIRYIRGWRYITTVSENMELKEDYYTEHVERM